MALISVNCKYGYDPCVILIQGCLYLYPRSSQEISIPSPGIHNQGMLLDNFECSEGFMVLVNAVFEPDEGS